jgi:adenine-specific DNA-methyltransferase
MRKCTDRQAAWKAPDAGSHLWGSTCTGIPEQQGFDLVIGNPPWISFGLRGTGTIDREMDARLRSLYPNSAEYKISTYALFIDRAIGLLRDGGFCGFIVPDSLLLGRYFSKIRRHILQTTSIRQIHLIEEDFWPHGSIGRSVIIILQKEPDPAARRSTRVKVSSSRSLADLKAGTQRTHAYTQQYFEGLPHHRFRLFFDQQSMDLVSHMEEGAILLRDIVSIHTGVRSRIGQKKVIGEEQKGPNWKPGIVSGREIGRYRLSYGGHYINIDPALLWSGGWDPEVVLPEKLIMRQTGDRLIATFDDTGLYHLNNCHSIAPKDKNYHLKFILAILNSRLMNRYYRLISLEQGRALAQIDIEMIGYLPIRHSPPEEQRPIVALVDELIACIRTCDTFTPDRRAPDALLARAHALEASIDERVFRLYGMNNAEIMGLCG